MTDGETAKFRIEALNLAYGILQQKFATTAPNDLLNPCPNTEAVLREAEKLTKFIEGRG